MKKKLVSLLLAMFILSGCTMSPRSHKTKPSPTSEETISEVTSVSLNRSELNFNLNTSHPYTVETLIASVEGNGDFDKSLTWKSSDQSIATVENGVVTALKVGSATISATSNQDSSKYATCNVKVVNDVPVVSYVTVLPENPEIDLKNSNTIQLTATVHGVNSPSQAVTWTYESDVLNVDSNGLVSATNLGYGTVTATSVADPTKYYTVLINVVNTTPVVNSVSIYAGSQKVTTYTLDIYESLNKKSVQFTAKVDVQYSAPTTVTWSSSDPTKVSIDASTGLANALKVTGATSVTITATSTYDSTKIATVKVVVNDSTPRVSNVSVSLQSSLRLNKTTTAVADVIGTGLKTEDKTVTWSSSNPQIAKIDANTGLITPVAVGGPITITATSNFDNTKSGKANLIIKEAATLDEYTIMLYVCGADLETNFGYASTDIQEIVNAGAAPDGVNIIFETGGANSWNSKSKQFTSDGKVVPEELTRWVLNDSRKLEKEPSNLQPNDANMGSLATFSSFLDWGLENYPAEKTGVVLWNHGGGISGACFDERHSSDGLTPGEAYDAFRINLGEPGSATKLEWIGYDCCTMQMADIASINDDFFHYQVASQELEAGGGWYYTDAFKKLYQSIQNKTTYSTEEFLTDVCDDFVSDYGTGYDNYQVLSYLKLDNMHTFTNAFNEFTADYNSSTAYSTVKTAAVKSLRFSEYQGEYQNVCYGDVDMLDLLLKLGASSTSTVVQSLLNVIGYSAYCANASVYQTTKPSGVNAFVAFQPSGYYIQIMKSDYNYQNGVVCTKFTTWCDMNRNYGKFYSYY